MNWREHPPMHFHAVYGEHEALMTLDVKQAEQAAAAGVEVYVRRFAVAA